MSPPTITSTSRHFLTILKPFVELFYILKVRARTEHSLHTGQALQHLKATTEGDVQVRTALVRDVLPGLVRARPDLALELLQVAGFRVQGGGCRVEGAAGWWVEGVGCSAESLRGCSTKRCAVWAHGLCREG